MKIKIIFCNLLFLFFFGFFASAEGVVINVIDKTKGKTNLSFRKYPKIFVDGYLSSENIGEQKQINDSTYRFTLSSVNKPQILHCSWIMGEKQVIMTPGDTLTAVIDYQKDDLNRFQVTFAGKNEENYNARDNYNVNFNRNGILKKAKTMPLKDYIQFIDSMYKVNTRELNCRIRNTQLKEMMLEEEKAVLFYYLDYAVSINSDTLSNKELLLFMKKYYPKKIDILNPIFIENRDYTYYITCLGDLLTRNKNLMEATGIINKYFTGNLRDYLLASKFHSIYVINSRNSRKDPDMGKWYNLYGGKFKDKSYNDFTDFVYNNFKKLNQPFSEQTLDEKLTVVSNGEELSLRELLERYKGQQIVLDHWATWCGPCLQEMEVGKKNVERLKKLGNVFVYISLDDAKNAEKVKMKATELGIVDKTYILKKGFSSEYSKYLNIKEIPRFVLIDTKGRVKKLLLSYPSDSGKIDNYK